MWPFTKRHVTGSVALSLLVGGDVAVVRQQPLERQRGQVELARGAVRVEQAHHVHAEVALQP